MKKTSVKRISTKPQSRKGSVDEYFSFIEEPARSTLHKVRAIIHSVLPAEATEIISYGVPAFKYRKVLVWYAAFSDHCSLFPTASVIEQFKDELKSYRISKGTIQFPVNKPLPAGLLKKMVRARLARVETRSHG